MTANKLKCKHVCVGLIDTSQFKKKSGRRAILKIRLQLLNPPLQISYRQAYAKLHGQTWA